MNLSEMLLPEFDQEMSSTRKTLERVPEDKFGWKPHEKSTAMGGLATHLANIPTWTVHTLDKDELDIAPPGAPPVRAEEVRSRGDLLEKFDKNVQEARAAIAAASDERWFGSWSLLHGGNKLFTMPRAAVMRTFVLSHSIHHRAQLGVYLRLNDVPVPAVYGPSADESSF
jgi:uncharacterized damage-inducible protein DinB